MLMTRVSPFTDFKTMRELLNTPNTNVFMPKVNTREGEEAYHIEVELPGMKKEDINVEVDKGVLTISGKREFRNELEEKDYYKVESSYGKFYRSFTLPENIDIENIKASSTDGILEVVVPKMERQENKKLITID